MQILPSPSLAHIVRHFLIIENDRFANVSLRMFSDGNTGMVFNFGDPLIHFEGVGKHSVTLPPAFLYGQPDCFQDIISSGKIRILIAVFHPFGISSLLKIPAVELRNKILDLQTFYFSESLVLTEKVINSSDIFSRIRTVENFLADRLSKNSSGYPLSSQAVHLIHQQNGNISVDQLTSCLQVSERKLQRTFEEHIGISPKRYAGVTRVQHFLKMLRNNSGATQTQLVYEAGFFDQAHLIREMKNISGITPGQYVSQPNILAANFLQIPEK